MLIRSGRHIIIPPDAGLSIVSTRMAAAAASPFPVDANTVARYTHSDGAGLVLSDSSGNGNNGTLNGATWSATVPVGWTLS